MVVLSFPYFAVVFMGSTLFAFQQLSGINAVFYFSSTIFKSFGVPSDVANTCVGISNLLGTNLLLVLPVLCIFKWYTCNAWISFTLYATSGSIIAMILMDKLGRKVLLLGSFSGMVSSKRTQKYLLKNGRRPTKDMYSEYISCLGIVVGPSSNCSKFFRIGIWGIVPICWWHASVSY